MKKTLIKLLLSLLAVIMLITAITAGTAAFAADETEQTITASVSGMCEVVTSSEERQFTKKTVYGAAFNGSYGAQITGLSKEFYNSFVKQFITKRTGAAYTHQMKITVQFDANVVGNYIYDNASLNNAKQTVINAIQCAMDAFLYDYPQAFWIYNIAYTTTYSATYNSSTGKWVGKISEIYIEPIEAFTNGSSYISAFDENVQDDVEFLKEKIEEFGLDLYNRYDVAGLIHDYICVNAYYRDDYSNKIVYCSAPFFLSDRGFVCEGYAETFKILCDEFDIPCVLVSGDAGGAHMWNYVQMEDGKWYLVDATWDDTDSGVSATYRIVSAYQYGFTNLICNERTPDGDFNNSGIMTFTYPTLSTSAYVVHTHEWETSYRTDRKATCAKKGIKSIHCKTCSATKLPKEIPLTSHSYKATSVKTKATLSADGVMNATCSVCSKKTTTKINRPKTIALSKSSCTYDGKVKTPTVTVKDSAGKTLKKDTDYTVAYAKGRKLPGKYAVKVTFKGKYSGSKMLYFTIAPKTTAKVTAKSTLTTITLKWNAVTGATNYRVYRYNATNKKYESIASGLTSTSYTVKSLKAAKTYKFKIVAYTKSGSTTIWGDYSKAYTFSTTPATPKLAVKASAGGKATVTWSNVSGETGYEVYWSSSQNSGYKKLATTKANVTSMTLKSLSPGKVYYFRVRAIIKTADGTAYGGYNTVGVRAVK